MNYTVIKHDVRIALQLSCNDYCVLDLIDRLGENVGGWCFASRSKMGEMLGFTKVTILSIIQNLVAKELIEIDPKSKFTRTTDRYRNFTAGIETIPNLDNEIGIETIPLGKESLPIKTENSGIESLPIGIDALPVGIEPLPTIGKESLPPSYSKTYFRIREYSNNSYAPLVAAPNQNGYDFSKLIFSSKENENPPPSSASPPSKKSSLTYDEKGVATCQELRENLLEYQAKNPGTYPIEMYKAFMKYWSEPNEKGTPRWKTIKQKKDGRFYIPGRLATWHENDKKTSNGSNRNTSTYRGSGSSLRPMGQAEPQYRGGRPLPDVEL